MANTRELRRRIRSIKNTSQITKAMQMVAATKMRRAQAQAISGRPYDSALENALAKLSSSLQSESSPLLAPNGSSNVGILLLTTDKSLCGALNTNVFRATLSFLKEIASSSDVRQSPQFVFYTIGKKGRNFVVRIGNKLEADFENTEIITFRQAKQISRLLLEAFLSGQVGKVYMIYPDFISTLKQEPKIVKLLPTDPSSVIPVDAGIQLTSDNSKLGSRMRGNDKEKTNQSSSEFLFEPSPNDLLDFVLNHKIETKIYQVLLETKASEHSARMMAMQNATDNANELIGDMQLSYNQIRQASITNELLEITSAGAALE